MSEEENVIDDWRRQQVTRVFRRRAEEAVEHALTGVLGAARVSQDPDVRAAVAQYTAALNHLEVFTGDKRDD